MRLVSIFLGMWSLGTRLLFDSHSDVCSELNMHARQCEPLCYSGMQCVHAHLQITRNMNYTQLISFNFNNKKFKYNMVPYT